MLLERIEARTLPEALDRVTRECGPDALVVETKQTRTGYLVLTARRPEPGQRDQAGSTAFLSSWTHGFRPLAEQATDFGLSLAVLRAVEGALISTRVDLSRPHPALPALASRVLSALVHTEPRVETGEGAFRTLAVVGPTGVGKTTTLAKLAARAKARGQRVAVVTLDTYRVAAVEQVRAFAHLMDIPCEVAVTAADLRSTLQQHADCDRILVDTTGSSARAAMPLLDADLRAGGCSALLCLAAGTRARDCSVMFDAYEPLGIAAVCLTKWDETVAPGEALAAVVEQGLPLSHLCTGPEVPADIVAADALAIARAAFADEVAGAVP
ncbi:MAG TPA: GTP-binding protein [Planctomycetota bacterium]|nr:GTP-binding protein [Planctomycetota bacterium]